MLLLGIHDKYTDNSNARCIFQEFWKLSLEMGTGSDLEGSECQAQRLDVILYTVKHH